MTYTFDPHLTDAVSRVRFEIGDNHPEGHFLEDETIQYHITNSSEPHAVVRCIRYILTQLSQPDFKQDWLSVSYKEARAGYEKLLRDKEKELGLQTAYATSTISMPRRTDSFQQDNDYTDSAPEESE